MAYPPQKEMEEALLNALYEAGGKAGVSKIYGLLTDKFSTLLTHEDLTKINKSGDNTWRNKVRWLRENLIPKGELIGVSKGIWGITPKGIERIGKQNDILDSEVSNYKRRTRKATESKNLETYERKASQSFQVYPKHNILQTQFRELLIDEFGSDRVIMEENNTDLKVVLKDKIIFYEIKPYTSAEGCIREALGQLLSYVFFDTTKQTKEIVIVGPNPPNEEEQQFIDYIKSNLSIPFLYKSFKPKE
jgi:hypothetical protein